MTDILAEMLWTVSWKALAVVGFVWGLSLWSLFRERPAAAHALWVSAALTVLAIPLVEAAKITAPASTYPQVQITLPVQALAVEPAPIVATPGREGSLTAAAAVGGLYVLGLLVALARLAYGSRKLSEMRRGAVAVKDLAVQAELASLASVWNRGEPPTVFESEQFSGPVTLGLWSPSIFLPGEYRRWTGLRLRSVLAHECAHIVRRDTLWTWLVALTRAIYWFHPAAWLIQQRTAVLMEQACDDFAVRAVGDSGEYAQALVATASADGSQIPQQTGALAMASNLTSRIDRVLDGESWHSGTVRRRWAAVLVLGVVVTAGGIGTLSTAWAQAGRVTLTGKVLDPSGARVAGTTAILRNAELDLTEVTVTGSDGSFVLRGLEPSESYEISLERGGFARLTQPVALTVSQEIELRLAVGGIREAIVVEADAPGPSSTSGTPQRIRVGGKVQKARMKEYKQPVYPEAARAEGIEGTVLLEAVISKSGVPLTLRVVNNLVDERLANAAKDAVGQWRYEPTQLNGEPVEVVTTVTVGFQLRR